nr:ClassA_beta_lactamase [uncultured bacterium]
MKAFTLTAIFMLSLTPCVFSQRDVLHKRIKELAATVDGQAGVAIMDLSSKDTLLYNVHGRFAMQSVYKFQLGLAVLNEIDKEALSLDKKIRLTKENLLPNTYSPMRDKYPGGNVELPLRDVLKYLVTNSDNNACDILFKELGGTKRVNRYVHDLGVNEMEIAATEDEMHQGYDVQFTNWSTPRATLQLLEMFYDKKLLKPASQELMWKMMVETTTGPKRLKGLLPEGVEAAHRTGLGDRDTDGRLGAVNDVGIVKLPNGKYYAIVVYIGRAKGELPDLEKVIAEISLAAYKSQWLNK